MSTLPKVYFSYAWGDKTPQGRPRAEAADALYQELKAREGRGELQVMIDHEQMGYKDRIRDFTRQYGDSSILIIMIISEKYLLSPYCMGEAVEILSNKDYRKRTFPVVLPDAKLKDGIKLAQYYKDWEKRKRELKAAIDEIEDKTYAGPLIEQLKDIAEIIRIIAEFTTEMGETLTARPPDYAPLLKALDKRIVEMESSLVRHELEENVFTYHNQIKTLERRGVEGRLHLLIQKQQALQEANDLETDAARRFAYKHQLAELDTAIEQLKKQLGI
jgi:cell fate (sporulation/competence/biofilm development) regulator YmcA (YheA/YmcA/DUF963 family)